MIKKKKKIEMEKKISEHLIDFEERKKENSIY